MKTLPPIPENAEYVVCPSCGTVGWREIGTDLPCPNEPDVLAVPLTEALAQAGRWS